MPVEPGEADEDVGQRAGDSGRWAGRLDDLRKAGDAGNPAGLGVQMGARE